MSERSAKKAWVESAPTPPIPLSDLLRMGLTVFLACATGFFGALEWNRTGVEAGKRALQIAEKANTKAAELETAVAVAKRDVAELKSGLHGVKISVGRSISSAVKPIVAMQREIAQAQAAQNDILGRIERTTRERWQALEYEIRYWRARDVTPRKDD